MRVSTAIALFATASSAASPALAVDVERLISPGPLIRAHQREASDCEACHKSFDRGAESELCRVCHEAVASDIERSLGFHGHLPEGSSALCRSCHTEHKGPDASISPLVPEWFDHRRTDLPLEGAHSATSCGECHPIGKAYREAPSACIDCHREDDAHQGSLGETCGDCHSADDWAKVGFDHGKTEFPLTGRHADTECVLCHPQQRFDAASSSCADCHGFDDVHRGSLGPACGECHQPAGWKSKPFDHAEQTGFALRGDHASVDCQGCHRGDPTATKLDSACSSCHLGDDDHVGRYGTDCGACHDARSWEQSQFDHASKSAFALHGAHAKIDCELCHVVPVGDGTPTLCVDCHATVDVHAGAEGSRCEKCHTDASWRDTRRFDHDLTRFPLLGMHQLATCEDCHVTHDFREVGRDCVDCHRGDDVHKSQLGPSCAQCHDPSSWARWSFDHDRQSDFVLNGAHRELDCLACHRKPTSGAIELSAECRSCHLQDSPHGDGFGRNCERCHSEARWQEIRPDR